MVWRADRNKIPDALAAYLDGYGVVYQLAVAPPGEEPEKKKEDAAVTEEPPTRWEATRRELLGTTGDDTEIEEGVVEEEADIRVLQQLPGFPIKSSSDAVPTRSLQTQKLLDLLAENGHNFRHLKPEERLTVALTFRTSAPSDDGKPLDALYRNLGNGRFVDVTQEISGQRDTESVFGVAARDYDNDGDLDLYVTNDHVKETDELTGELHLRQGNYQKAVEAYEKAIPNAVKNNPYKHKPTSEQVSMYQKLVQAQVGSGQYAKAQQLMEAITNAQAKPSSSEKPEPRFPARLVISATKAHLDQVAVGKMTGEQFNKDATVEYFDPQSVTAGRTDSDRRRSRK